MALGCKSAILGFPSKRGFTICGTQKLCSAENIIFIVFSAKHSFVDMKECNLRKTEFTKNRGCLPNCKKFFFGYVFLLLGGLFFCCLCFCACVL